MGRSQSGTNESVSREKEAEPTPVGGVARNGSLATTISSASNGIVQRKGKGVNKQFSQPGGGMLGIPVFIPVFTFEEKTEVPKDFGVGHDTFRDEKEAMSLLQRAGHQLSGGLIPRDGFINSIRDPKSPVKPGLENVVSAYRNKRATVYNVGKVNGSVPPSAKLIAVVGSKPLGGTLPANSVEQESRNVNKQFSLSAARNTEEETAIGETVRQNLNKKGTNYLNGVERRLMNQIRHGKSQRKSRYGGMEEYDIPTIDFFRIEDYRIPNNGFIY